MPHSRLQRVWDLRFKTRSENLLYPQRIVDHIQFEELIEDDEERVELHNWLTDSENSDQSDSDC